MSQLKNINFKNFVKEKKLANERKRIKFDRKKEGQNNKIKSFMI
jgi:hypothetical protein